MFTILLTLAIMTTVDDDINFSGFTFDKPEVKTKPPVVKSEDLPPPFFPAQILPAKMETPKPPKVEEPIRPEVYYATDKFGQRWQHTDKSALDQFINTENQKPFQATDVFGRIWQHQDKAVLDQFIQQQNVLAPYCPTGNCGYGFTYMMYIY